MANEFIIKNGFQSKGDSQVTGSLNISGSLIASELTASGLNYPNADGIDGQVLVTDGLGNISFGHGEKLHLQVRNDDTVTIPAGTPIYSTGEIGGSERIKVRIASASNAATMPAIGIVETTLTTTGDTQDGFAIINGVYNENITPVEGSPAIGDNVYVYSNGGLTTVKPTGSNLIQNIGIVLKTGGGQIQGMKVSSIDRTNDVPNISPGYTWIGNSDSVATPTATSSIQNVVSSSYALTASHALNAFPFTGDAQITGSLTVSGSVVDFTDATAISGSIFSGSFAGNGSQVSMVWPSASSNQSYEIAANYKSGLTDTSGPGVVFVDDYIEITWDFSQSDIDGEILTDPSSGRAQVVSRQGTSEVFYDALSSIGKFQLSSNFTTDSQIVVTINAPDDDNYPTYRLVITRGSTLYYDKDIHAVVQKSLKP